MMVVACNTLVGLDRDYALTSDAIESEASVDASGEATITPPSSGDSGADTNTPLADSGMDADSNVPPADTGADTKPPPSKLVHCGSAAVTCAVGTQTCCSKVAGGYSCSNTTACTCAAAGSCINLHLDCDDETDCPANQVCCGTLTGDRYALQGATCTTRPTCVGTTKTPLCDLTDPVERCPDGGVCHDFADSLFPGVGRCF